MWVVHGQDAVNLDLCVNFYWRTAQHDQGELVFRFSMCDLDGCFKSECFEIGTRKEAEILFHEIMNAQTRGGQNVFFIKDVLNYLRRTYESIL